MNATTTRPLFKEMTDAALIDAYWSTRALIANADGTATLHAQMGMRSRVNKSVGQIFKLQRDLDIIVAVARKRGLRFIRAVTPGTEIAA